MVVGATILCAPLAKGQNPGIAESPRSQSDAGNYKLRVNSNLVFLPTRVETRKGETIYGLTAEEFIVEDNGVRQFVKVDEEADSAGVSLAVLVQCGRSMEFNKLKGLNTMIGEIVGDAPHEVAIVAYGERPYVLDNFSSRPDAIPLALSRLQPCGDYHAVAIDAVSYAINMLRRRHNDYRHAILLIGEMRDYGSRSRLPDIIAELGVNDIVIYSVAFSPAKSQFLHAFHNNDDQPQGPIFVPPPAPAGPPPEVEAQSSPPPDPAPLYKETPPLLLLPPEIQPFINALKANTASELASLSGGEYINFTTQRAFENGLQRISNHIHDYYLLSFKPSSSPTSSLHTLSVRVPAYPDAFIQTRKSYWPLTVEATAGNER